MFCLFPRGHKFPGGANGLCKRPWGWNTLGELEANRAGAEGTRESGQREGRTGRQSSQHGGQYVLGAVLLQAPRGQHGPQGAYHGAQFPSCRRPWMVREPQPPWLQSLCTPFIEHLLSSQAHAGMLRATTSWGGQGGGPPVSRGSGHGCFLLTQLVSARPSALPPPGFPVCAALAQLHLQGTPWRAGRK